MLADLLGLPLQGADAMPDLPAVHLELCFTRTAGTNSAAEPRKMRAVAGQTRQSIS